MLKTVVGFVILVAIAYMFMVIWSIWTGSETPQAGANAGYAVLGGLFGGRLVDPFQKCIDAVSSAVFGKK